MLAASDLVPKDFKGKPENCLIAVQWGSELGLKAMQALQNIAVINGRASLWGDAVLGLVRASPVCEYVTESDDGETATCRAKRKGQPEEVRTFSMKDAELAGLKGKPGPWTQYTKRMRQMRARAFALRDLFTDVLRGMPIAEELMDMPKDMGPVEYADTSTPAKPAEPMPYWTAEKFAESLPVWRKAIAEGRAGKGDAFQNIIDKASAKGSLSPEQVAEIRQPLTEKEIADGEAFKANSVTDAAPKMTYAQVTDRFLKATTREALDEAADLIKNVSDEGQRKELDAYYEVRKGEVA